jgi:hypothetical protein
MLHRMPIFPVVPVVSALVLAGCQPYGYPNYWNSNRPPPASPAAAQSHAAQPPATPSEPGGTPPVAAAPQAAAAVPATQVAAATTPPTEADAAVAVNLNECRRSVSFSAKPATPGQSPASPGTETIEYVYESGSYGERARCTCKIDIDYSKLTQFDAVENARRNVEKRGFTLEKAVFDDTEQTGKELAFEASGKHDSDQSFLVGRNLYGECGLTVTATGTSYADFVRAKKFLASVSAEQEEKAAGTGYGATITTAGKGADDAQAPKAEDAGATQQATNTGTTAPPTPPAPPKSLTQPVDKPAAPLAASDKAAEPAPAKDVATAGSDAQASADRPTTPQPSSQPPGTVAARLLQLNELLEQKLITPGEYDARRRAILDSL